MKLLSGTQRIALTSLACDTAVGAALPLPAFFLPMCIQQATTDRWCVGVGAQPFQEMPSTSNEQRQIFGSSSYILRSSTYQVPGTRYQVPGTRYLVIAKKRNTSARSGYTTTRTTYQVPGMIYRRTGNLLVRQIWGLAVKLVGRSMSIFHAAS